jgi:ribose transport system permease protein
MTTELEHIARPTARQPILPRAVSGEPFGRIIRAALSEYSVLFIAVFYFLALWPLKPELAGSENLLNLLASLLPLLALTLGEMFVLITGGIDLSVSSIIAVSSVAGGWVMNERSGWLAGSAVAVPAAIVVMLLVGAAVGAFNGLAITLLEMPPFIVTLATMMGVSGAAVWATRSRNIGNLPDAFINFASGSVGGIPVALVWVMAIAIAAHVLLTRSRLGRLRFSVGVNAPAARVSGGPVSPTTATA